MKDSPVVEIILLVCIENLIPVIISFEIYLRAFGEVNKFDMT